MKLRVKIEDFIADEEDKELARVAFHRAEKVLRKRMILVFIPLLVVGFPALFLSGLAFFEAIAITVFGAYFIICVVMLFKWHDVHHKEYNNQLDELKLQMRNRGGSSTCQVQ